MIDYKKLANNLMFEINDNELNLIKQDFDDFLQLLSLMNEVDTTNVSESVYPYIKENSILREDDDYRTLDKEAIFKNCPNEIEGYFAVRKVL